MLCASLAERIFLFVNRENLRIFPIYFFTGEVVAANSICSAAFCESAALQETNPLRLTPFASSPEGGAFCHLLVSAQIKLPLRGSWHAVRRD